MKEIWKNVRGYRSEYKVSNKGRVISFKASTEGKAMKHWLTQGYPTVQLFKDGDMSHKSIHRLVAIAFIPNKHRRKHVNHKNGKKWDNRVNNLEWSTRVQNRYHALQKGLQIYKKCRKLIPSKGIVLYVNAKLAGSWKSANKARQSILSLLP